MSSVRTRFAPSPTGYMHVGGVRTALFAWLVARQAGGQFILRLEDTDKAREVSGSGDHIMESLRWLGIDWDEGPDKGGAHGPYTQSERLPTYKEWAQKLVAAGKAYADPYNPAEVEAFRNQAKAAKQPFLYRNHRPDKPPEWDGSQPLRLKAEPKSFSWQDEVMGELHSGPEAIDDFILIKSDGYPTYNFAHIIDDHLMEISHVIRSQEFIASIPRFLSLYEALGFTLPKLAIVPYVMGADGRKKLSKRDGAKDILDYAHDGYLPAALVNFMASLGWNDGTEQEIFSVDELIKKFSLSRVQRGGAVFDERRLLWMNGAHIRELSAGELYRRATDGGYWPEAASQADESYKHQVLSLVQERLKFLGELRELTGLFFSEPAAEAVKKLFTEPSDKQLKNTGQPAMAELLDQVIASLNDSDFSEADITSRLNGLLETLNTKPGILFSVVRIGVSGAPSSPAIFGTLHVLGKETSLRRLQAARQLLG